MSRFSLEFEIHLSNFQINIIFKYKWKQFRYSVCCFFLKNPAISNSMTKWPLKPSCWQEGKKTPSRVLLPEGNLLSNHSDLLVPLLVYLSFR